MTVRPTKEPLPALASRQRELARLLAPLAPTEGIHSSPWPDLEIMRADRPQHRSPVVYQPSLCLVAQGSKRAFLGGDSFTYDDLHYLVLSVPLPLECEIVEATPERPFLALRLHLEATKLSELLLEAESEPERRANRGVRRGIHASPVTEALHDAVCRLVAAVNDPSDLKVLAPLAEREVLYRLLTGEQAQLLRDVALRDSRSHRIAQILRFMQTNYEEPLDIPTIAEAAHMSPSTLHHAFKSVTSSSPLQYLKTIRLYQARLLMLHDGLGAGEAAHRVGYGSESQFSREYRRLFGAPPIRDVRALREAAVG